MYNIYLYAEEIKDNIYDIKIPNEKINIFLEKYNFIESKIIKEYWENNVMITFSDKYGTNFKYITDIDIEYDSENKCLIQEFSEKDCIPYNFSVINLEEIYELYEIKNDEYNLKLKKYDKYFTIEITVNDLKNINNINNFYI